MSNVYRNGPPLSPPPLELLHEYLTIDLTSPSALRWIKDRFKSNTSYNTPRAGDVFGYCPPSHSYWQGRFFGKKWRLHRLVIYMHTGEYHIDLDVDHIDRNKKNNDPFNLRWVTHEQNMRNRVYSQHSI